MEVPAVTHAGGLFTWPSPSAKHVDRPLQCDTEVRVGLQRLISTVKSRSTNTVQIRNKNLTLSKAMRKSLSCAF